jgi:hypothetical protein
MSSSPAGWLGGREAPTELEGQAMRVLPTRIHGILDYLVGLALIAAPWVLDFADGGAEQWVPVLLGIGVVLYSVVTDYELGLARALPMPVHLWLDFGGGLVLAVSPWLFGFAEAIWWPHVLFGVLEMGVSLLTRTVPEDAHAASPFTNAEV